MTTQGDTEMSGKGKRFRRRQRRLSLGLGLAACRLGLHRWSKLGHTKWIQEPVLYRNELGTAMEYRTCERGCAAITDVSTFPSSIDEDYRVPLALGPIAAKRWREIAAGPRRELGTKPLPIATQAPLAPPKDKP